MKVLALFTLVLACSGTPTVTATPSTEKRPPPPVIDKDSRPIAFGDFAEMLNARDANSRTIHASADGGCHVYVRDRSKPPGPPGSYPPPTTVACPAAMLAAEWGHCVGADTLHTNAARDQCICYPGEGDPPLPPFRLPCPR